MSRRTQPATRMPRWLAILLVSLGGLLLEVGCTRIVSFKLWCYYTYLVIGLALLGIGTVASSWPSFGRHPDGRPIESSVCVCVPRSVR